MISLNTVKSVVKCLSGGVKGAESVIQRTAKSAHVSEPILEAAPKTIGDTFVKVTKEVSQEINKKADDLLMEIRKMTHADYVEKYCPDVVANVAKGNVKTGVDMEYEAYKFFEDFRKKAPEAFVLLGTEKGNVVNLRLLKAHYGNVPFKIAKNMPIEEIKKIFAETDKFFKKHTELFDGEKPSFDHYIQMLILKKNNPKLYNYFMTTTNNRVVEILYNWGCDSRMMPSSSMLSNITPEQIQVMMNDKIGSRVRVGEYVRNSDSFILDKQAVKKLSEDLSKHHLSTDVKLYRGEKTVGMFDSVAIDKDFESQIRAMLEKNKEKAKNMKVKTYNGKFDSEPKTNLYDFLTSRKTLTLADAMQMAKFGDEKFINELIKRIKSAKIIDKRFKSLSFDGGMASSWASRRAGDSSTPIIQNVTVKKGTQGGFDAISANSQYEVILNNTPKEITFQDVVYYPKADNFEIKSTIQNV